MNLVFLTSDFPFGKGETFIENEIKILAKHFDSIIIINTTNSETARSIPKNVFTKIIPLKRKPKDYFFLTNLSFLKEFFNNLFSNPFKNKVAIKSWLNAYLIYKELNRYDFNNHIFYSYWLDDKAIALSILKNKYNNTTCISRAHRWDIYEEEHLYGYLPFRKFIFANLNSIYSISEDGKNYLKEKGAKNIDISRLGVKSFDGSTQNIIQEDSLFYIISISSLIKRKRIGLLLDTLKAIDQNEYKIKWIHFGDGKEFISIKERAKDVENVIVELKGQVKNSDVKNWLANNNKRTVLVNLSESEGVPVSMMEAMSFGIPCIGTNVGGVSEIINNENGLLLSPNPDKQEIVEALRKLYYLNKEEFSLIKNKAFETWDEKYNADKNYSDFIKKIKHL